MNESKINLPYREPDLDALRERIRRQTTSRTQPAHRHTVARSLAMAAAAIAIAITAGFYALRDRQPVQPPIRIPVERMIATASAETLQKAAAENYDDILTNQQL